MPDGSTTRRDTGWTAHHTSSLSCKQIRLWRLTSSSHRPGWRITCTALLDAIGGAIHHIGNVHKYARLEDVPEHTMFVITPDGMENASRRYNSEKVKQMIEQQKAKYGWEFLFLGANIDAVETASQFGIGADRAVNYQCDGEGTALNYEVVSEAISAVRCSAPLSADWKKRIDEDYKKRGGRKHK